MPFLQDFANSFLVFLEKPFDVKPWSITTMQSDEVFPDVHGIFCPCTGSTDPDCMEVSLGMLSTALTAECTNVVSAIVELLVSWYTETFASDSRLWESIE